MYKLTFLLALSALTLVSCSKGNNAKSEESSTSNSTYQYSSPSGYGNYNSLLSDEYEDDEYAEDEDDADDKVLFTHSGNEVFLTFPEAYENYTNEMRTMTKTKITPIYLMTMRKSPTCRMAVWVNAGGIPLPAPPLS